VVDTTLRTTAGQIVLYAAALIPVSLLPTLFHATGVIYLTAAMALGSIFAGFGVLCALSRARAEARQLFLVSIIYLPLLLCVMMVDKM
jgi:protoheme IX farnesyltransferase